MAVTLEHQRGKLVDACGIGQIGRMRIGGSTSIGDLAGHLIEALGGARDEQDGRARAGEAPAQLPHESV